MLTIIAGPCVIETEEICFEVAHELKRIEPNIIFKASYDKANRTKQYSYRGPGFHDGMKILKKIKKKTGLRITSDVHSPREACAASFLDIIQIPAMLSRQTDILVNAGLTGRMVNIKKGQNMTPEQLQYAILKVGIPNNTLVTERGTSCGFGSLVVDMRNIQTIKNACKVPVIIDASHPAGKRDMIPVLAKAGVAAGADGVFIEVHPDPDNALCDGKTSLKLSDFERLYKTLYRIKEALQNG